MAGYCLASIVKLSDLLVLLLLHEIDNKRIDAILLRNILKRRVIFAEHASEVHLVLLLTLWELVISPHGLPKDIPIQDRAIHGFLDMKGDGLDILLFCDLASVYDVGDDVRI